MDSMAAGIYILTISQLLSASLEESDPAVFSILQKVRHRR